jgi:hypothetical protein
VGNKRLKTGGSGPGGEHGWRDAGHGFLLFWFAGFCPAFFHKNLYIIISHFSPKNHFFEKKIKKNAKKTTGRFF